MQFCTECHNMYYIRMTENNAGLLYYCRNCGNTDDTVTSENMCITSEVSNVRTFKHSVNKYTVYDPTLPHITTIRCPNAECESNKDNGPERDVIYIRYNDAAMKYLYICTHCDTTWKTDEQH